MIKNLLVDTMLFHTFAPSNSEMNSTQAFFNNTDMIMLG